MKSSSGDADIENRLMHMGRREEGVGETNGESSMDAYTLTYVNREPRGICCMTQMELKWELCNNLEGWE